MNLHLHLHLLVPSSTPGIDVEARLYFPRELLNNVSKPDEVIKGLSTSASSLPITIDQIDHEVLLTLSNLDRLVIASHPWGRFGGNMLYP